MALDKSLLVRMFGHTATLIHGDTTVVDRWLWLRRRLFFTRAGERLLDVGCGTGAFSIGAALRGYQTLGLSWDRRNQQVARERALICKARNATFEVCDVRTLDAREDLTECFEVVVCFENIEHVLDDRKLLVDIARCLKPGGYLFLTAPYLRNKAITTDDNGPFSTTEDGWHVRRGYTLAMLQELCTQAGLHLEYQSFCSGFLSQNITGLIRRLSSIHPLVGWGLTLPLRIFPPIFDSALTRLLQHPHYSICIEAYKPRFSSQHK